MKIFITILILIIIYLLFLLSERDPYNPETFGGMKEMANMQNISSHIGDIKIQKLNNKFTIARFNGSEVLQFSINQNRCGILLNCKYPPYYKRFGKYCDNFTLTLEEFELIQKNSDITITIYDLISTHIKPN